MNTVKTEFLPKVRDKLADFESASPHDKRELETSMEVLASQIFLLMGEKDDEPNSLADAIDLLPIDRQVKRQLIGMLSEIQEALEVSDYDSGDDEDNEDIIYDLKSDFYSTLDEALNGLEKAK